MGAPKRNAEPYTYADYLAWPAEERWELIDGVAYDMSPAPDREHQQILLDLARLIAELTDEGPCETYIAPFDIALPEHLEATDEETTTVVQPDLSVFCRPELLDEHGAKGPPDVAIEILSESTAYKDQTVKLALYERHGVREYWIVNADAPYVMVYRLAPDGGYAKPDYYRSEERIRSDVLGGAEIPVAGFVRKARAAD
jgi:Uma2 family endonuclease